MNTAELKRALNLSKELKGLGMRSSYKDRPNVRAYITEAPPPSVDKLTSIIEPLVRQHVATLSAPQVEVTPELVKQIVQAMHALPENDKLEVSKGIRNAASFIYGGTKYGVHEMMHGAGSSTSSSTQVYSEVVAGSGTSWTLLHTPDAGTLRLYANGQRLTVTVDYTQVGTAITTLTSWVSGTVLADYQYA